MCVFGFVWYSNSKWISSLNCDDSPIKINYSNYSCQIPFKLDNVLDVVVCLAKWRNIIIDEAFNWTMRHALINFAHSSSVLSCLSSSSSEILSTARWKLNFLRVLIDYVIHKQRKYELFVERQANKAKQFKIRSKIDCRSADSLVIYWGWARALVFNLLAN